jgi:hypothetical protein
LKPPLQISDFARELSREPLLSGNSGLPQKPTQKTWADVALMFVRDDQRNWTSFHLRVLASGVRPLESKLPETLDELSA